MLQKKISPNTIDWAWLQRKLIENKYDIWLLPEPSKSRAGVYTKYGDPILEVEKPTMRKCVVAIQAYLRRIERGEGFKKTLVKGRTNVPNLDI